MSVQATRSGALPESEIFHILGNDRRRAIVSLLSAAEGHLDVSTVATEIATEETSSETVPKNLYKSVYVSLQQTHLPQLEENSIVVYDPEAKRIEPGTNFEAVLAYVNGQNSDPRRPLQVHLVVCLVGLLVIGLAGAGAPVFAEIDPILWATAGLSVVAASCLYWLLV